MLGLWLAEAWHSHPAKGVLPNQPVSSRPLPLLQPVQFAAAQEAALFLQDNLQSFILLCPVSISV